MFLLRLFDTNQVDVKKATPKPDGIGGMRGARGGRGGRGRGRGGRDTRVKGKGEQAGAPWKNVLCINYCNFLNLYTFSCKC
jgi:squid-like protein